jgi:hypothetical protein
VSAAIEDVVGSVRHLLERQRFLEETNDVWRQAPD